MEGTGMEQTANVRPLEAKQPVTMTVLFAKKGW